jgi:hypothetical protein
VSDDTFFGHGFKLVNGDLLVQDGRLAEISGQDNLLQALALRILTPLAQDVFNTTYGLDVSAAFTEPNPLNVVKQIIKLNLVRTLATDRRVADIRDIFFEDEPEYRERHPEVGPEQVLEDRHRRTWKVDVIIQTANNQTQTLTAAVQA